MLCPWSASSSSTPWPSHTCKECDGGGVCKHGRMRRACKECGSDICEHGHRRSKCKDGCGDGHVSILDATAVEEFDGGDEPHECRLVQAVGPRVGKRERDSNIKEVVKEEVELAAELTAASVLARNEAPGLPLRVAKNTTGYFGVTLQRPGKPKPYLARVSCGGKEVHLGSFATAEEAALRVAQSQEAQAEGEAAAAREASALLALPTLVNGSPPSTVLRAPGVDSTFVPRRRTSPSYL